MTELKKPMTVQNQLNLLMERGLIVTDEYKALKVLGDINYYVLTGYLHDYKIDNNKYVEGITFEKIYKLYQFDEELRSLLLSVISSIEQLLKTKIAYTIAMENEDPCAYAKPDFFKNKNDHIKFMNQFKESIKREKEIPFVKHHIENYDGKFPIWVAVETMTLGNIKFLYINLSSSLKKKISKQFDTNPIYLESWIENLRITRNMLAHNRRLYNVTFKQTPKLSENLISSEYLNNKIFIQIFMMKQLYNDDIRWIKRMKQLSNIFFDYNEFIALSDIGFPTNWENLLV